MATTDAEASKLLLDELSISCCLATLEEHPQLEIVRFVARARPAKIDEAGLRSMCEMLAETLDREKPFSVLWDLREMRPPSRAALRYGMDWMGEDANARRIDELVQSTIIISNSAVVRALCGWILKVSAPPRPVRICRDDASALDAAIEFDCARNDGS